MNKEIKKTSQSFKCAIRGIYLCVRTERNFRIHTCAAFYVTVFGILADLSVEKFAILMLCFAIMLSAETFNTAIERLCDKQVYCFDFQVKNAKDLAAGAVFVSALFCVIIGAMFFLNSDTILTIINALKENLYLLGFLFLSVPIAIGYIFLMGRNR